MEHADERPLQPGTITRLRAQTKNPDRVSVYVDGRFAFGVYRDVVLSLELRKGRFLSVEEQQQAIRADRVLVAKSRAMHYLGYRARSEHEVRQRLARSGFDEPVVEEAVARLRELGYLDDAEYARSYARSRFERGGYGPRRVRSDLMRRGVPRRIIDATIAEIFEARDDVLETAREQAAKRWPRLAGEEDPLKRRKKMYDYLLRRGFGYDTVRQVVDELE